MSVHLPILQGMFPGHILLGIEEVAKCLNLSKGHVQNLCYAKKFPVPIFKDNKISNRMAVSIADLAKYLDNPIPKEGKEAIKDEPIPVPDLIVKKKRGRPVGSTRKIASFQAALTLAVVREEVFAVFHTIEEEIEALTYADDERSCAEKFDEAKKDFGFSLMKAKSSLFASILELQIPPMPSAKKRIDKM